MSKRDTPEYVSWNGMRQRCLNKKYPSYKNYGKRGIKVCARWANSFAAFLADMGLKPSKAHSLDRIDNNGNYEPTNCRWATRREQRCNQRRPTLTESDAALIKALIENSELSNEAIAMAAGASKAAVACIRQGVSWADVRPTSVNTHAVVTSLVQGALASGESVARLFTRRRPQPFASAHSESSVTK